MSVARTAFLADFQIAPTTCPLLAQSGHQPRCCRMSAFRGKADMPGKVRRFPLLTQSRHVKAADIGVG